MDSSTRHGQPPVIPRLFIRIPARPQAAASPLPSISVPPAANVSTQPAPVPAPVVATPTYTSYAPDFLEYSTDPAVVPPGRNTYPVEQRRRYDALWRAGHFDQVPYGWCPQDEWTAFRLDFWPVLHDLRVGAAPRPMARPASVVPFVYVDLWRPPPFVLESEREVSLDPSSSGSLYSTVSALTDSFSLFLEDWLLPIAQNPLGFVNQGTPLETGPDSDSPGPCQFTRIPLAD